MSKLKWVHWGQVMADFQAEWPVQVDICPQENVCNISQDKWDCRCSWRLQTTMNCLGCFIHNVTKINWYALVKNSKLFCLQNIYLRKYNFRKACNGVSRTRTLDLDCLGWHSALSFPWGISEPFCCADHLYPTRLSYTACSKSAWPYQALVIIGYWYDCLPSI